MPQSWLVACSNHLYEVNHEENLKSDLFGMIEIRFHSTETGVWTNAITQSTQGTFTYRVEARTEVDLKECAIIVNVQKAISGFTAIVTEPFIGITGKDCQF